MAEERNVPVEILLDTTVNGTEYTKGQQGAKMTAFEAYVSVRDKAARIIEAPKPTPAAPAPSAPAKAATKKSGRKR